MSAPHNLPTIRFAVISEGIYSWPLYVAQAQDLRDQVRGYGHDAAP